MVCGLKGAVYVAAFGAILMHLEYAWAAYKSGTFRHRLYRVLGKQQTCKHIEHAMYQSCDPYASTSGSWLTNSCTEIGFLKSFVTQTRQDNTRQGLLCMY